MERMTGTFLGKSELRIFYRSWLPAAEPASAKAGLIIVHGAGEHSGRHEYFGTRYASKKNCALWALDLPGLGQSAGVRGHIDAFGDYLEDVGLLIKMVRSALPQRPIVLIGFSLGGLIALNYAEKRGSSVDGVAVSGPLLGLKVKVPLLKSAVAPILAGVVPKLSLENEIDATLLARNQNVCREYLADPLVYNKVTPRWFAEITRAMRETRANAIALAGLPVLILQGSADGIVDPETSRDFAAPLREYVEFPGFYHELFNEDERGQVFAVLDRWLDNHFLG